METARKPILAAIRSALPLLAVIVLVLLVAFPVLTYPMGRDQGMYANIGRSILAGGTPYIDMWDIKPPPIYYIYAAGIALFGGTTAGIRAIDFALVPLGMVGIYLIATQLAGKRSGLLAALLYGLFYFNEDFPSLTQNDSLVTIPMIWASFAALRAGQTQAGSRSAQGWSLLTGFLSGMILWFKHYFAFFVLALVITQIITRRKIIWREALAFALGGLLSGGSLLLYFWSQGMVQEMLIVAQGTAAYNAQGYDWGAFFGNMAHYWGFRWQVWHVLLILALLWLPARVFGHRERGWRLVWFWLLAALCFALIQAKGFDTHWIPMLPALAILAADTLERLIQWAARSRATLALVWYLISVIGLAYVVTNTTWGRAWQYLAGQESQIAYYDRFQANDLKPEQSLLVTQYLQERVAPGDTIFIWGFRPEVAFMANLRPATRYQAQFPLVAPWYPQAWQQNNVDILWAALPPYVLVLEDDYMPWVTDRDEASHGILQGYTELNNWLMANYERVETIGDFLIWKRHTP
jgi:4-amino-4-deoxy-L-arabinose transferase-like glycosyltransferase